MRAEIRPLPRNDVTAWREERGRLARVVEPEYLDTLSPTNPEAVRSRRDLQRVNWFMGSARLLTRALKSFQPRRIVELGAGDGSLLLELARGVSPSWSETELLLLDRHALVKPAALQQFSK